MRSRELSQNIDAEVMLAARQAARRANARFVIGWWIDGAERRLMLLPEGHHVTEEPPFLLLMRIDPTGRAELLAA
jgi:hypothetical protein